VIGFLRELLEPGAFSLARPAVAAAFALAAALWLLWSWRRPRVALAFPALAEARAAGALRRDPVALLAGALRAGALALLALVLAGPLREGEHPPELRPGLDVVLAVDTSGSMRALDAEVAGEWRRRLDLAREVVSRFAAERASAGDRVGVVVFGDTAFTLCPLTSDAGLVAAALDRIEAGMAGESTALGDALALSVKRASGGTTIGSPGAGGSALEPGAAVDPLAEARGEPLEGRLVVLLTDGRSNAGTVPVDVAAALARATGTRVHTVGIGTRGEVAMASRGGRRALRFERHDLDMETLASVAATSNGRTFEARTSGDLAAVYAEIDALERVERERPAPPAGNARPEPFLAGAGGLLLLEIALVRLALRRLP
jgi:Ca-activated chloride channel homolog